MLKAAPVTYTESMPKLPTVLDQLNQLVSLPSVSSTQPTLDQGNRAVVDRLALWLEDLGFAAEIQELEDSIPDEE